MNRNLVLLGICLLAVSFVGEVFGQKKKTSYRYCRYTDRKQRVRPE